MAERHPVDAGTAASFQRNSLFLIELSHPDRHRIYRSLAVCAPRGQDHGCIVLISVTPLAVSLSRKKSANRLKIRGTRRIQ